jgi:hypothetical protein
LIEQLDPRDVLSMKFIKPQVFFANREDQSRVEIPEEEQEELVIDPVYSIKDAGELATQIRVEIDRSFKFSVLIPPQRPKSKLAKS